MGPETEYALIPLTKGQFATVDLLDCGLVLSYKWHAYFDKSTGSFYARTCVPNIAAKSRQRTLGMHRLIMGDPSGRLIDHKNRVTLDNRKCQLRECDHKQSAGNRKWKSGELKGVSQLPGGKWRARLRIPSAKEHLGVFETKEQAARAYDLAAKAEYGDFAYLNEVKDGPR